MVSVNEEGQATTGNVVFAGDEGKSTIIMPQGDSEYGNSGMNRVPSMPVDDSDSGMGNTVDTYPIRPTTGPQVIVVTPYQISEAYSRARNIVMSSQCYHMLADVREITYLTGLTGTKFISNMVPSDDFTEFKVTVSIKLEYQDRPVFYEEYPVTVDLRTNKITQCKGRRLAVEDII